MFGTGYDGMHCGYNVLVSSGDNVPVAAGAFHCQLGSSSLFLVLKMLSIEKLPASVGVPCRAEF